MRILTVVFIAAIALAACARPEASPAPATDIAAIRSANDAYEKALLDGDAAALDRALADDFVFIGWEGETWGKAAHIRDATEGHDLTTSSARDLDIRILAPTVAQVTGIWEGDAVTDGKSAHAVERFSNVWIRTPAGWRVELEHTSPLK